MLSGFKQFILRGNVVDLAVGVVIGAAFGSVVTAFTTDLLTPFIAALVGKPDFSAVNFTVGTAVFKLGDFINALVSFLLVAAAVYFFVVTPRIRRPRSVRSARWKFRSMRGDAGSARRNCRRPKQRSRRDLSVAIM
jgi:large conductance mechanosensitive channel protein